MGVAAPGKLASGDLYIIQDHRVLVTGKPSVIWMDLFMVEIVPRETLLAIQTFHSDRFQTLTFLIPTLLFPWMLWFSLWLLLTRKWLYKIPMLGKIKGKRRRGDRGWDGWMASLTRSAWVWVNSGSWWCGKPGVLRFMGSQRVGHDWATELTDWLMLKLKLQYFGHLIQRADSLKKMLMLGKMEGKRRRGQQSMRGKIQRTRIWENPGR